MATVSFTAFEIKRLVVISLLSILNSCSGQTTGHIKTASDSNRILPSGRSNANKTTNGIIYFSADNGFTWEDKSAGLPANISIGLGGVAVSGNRLAILSKDSGLYFFQSRQARWGQTPTPRQIIESNPGALTFYKNNIYVGTQFGGVFYSVDEGKSWTKLNRGLKNTTIRKLAAIDGKLYAATNAGLFSYDDLAGQWEMEYGSSTMQVNGLAELHGNLYIATSQGAFMRAKGEDDWKKVFQGGALHNISADDEAVYAMVYNELFSSLDNGVSWQSIQRGLPAQLYTFNVLKSGNAVFAGQWDGVYRKNNAVENWKLSSNGLPEKYAITNMQVYNGIIVVSGNERKLRSGMTTDK